MLVFLSQLLFIHLDAPLNLLLFFFFNDTATTEIYTLSLHDALPICVLNSPTDSESSNGSWNPTRRLYAIMGGERSEEHTSELQSHSDLVCRLLLEKKKTKLRRNKWTTPSTQTLRNHVPFRVTVHS